MEYTARHYVRLNGRMVSPGEIVTVQETDERVARLLRMGALEQESDFQMELQRLREQEEEQIDRIDDPDTLDDDPDGQEEATTQDAPEIDAMDGIVGSRKTDTKKRGRARA